MNNHETPPQVLGSNRVDLSFGLRVSVNSGINNGSDAQTIYWALRDYKFKQFKYLLSEHVNAIKEGNGDFEDAADMWAEIKSIEEIQTNIALQSIELAEANYWAYHKLKNGDDVAAIEKLLAKRKLERHQSYVNEFEIAIKP